MPAGSLFPEPSTADQVASVDHLRKDARAKIAAAHKMHDARAVEYWRGELERLTRLRATVVNASQMDMLQPQEGSLL